jgi:hypothetical protein
VAASLGVELTPIDVRDASGMEHGVAGFTRGSNGGLIVTASPSAVLHRELIIRLAARHRLPAVYPNVGATIVCLVFVLGSASTFAQQHTMPSGKVTDEEIIKSAMSAAPEAIGKGATIIDVGSDGKIRVVRQGSNQFTCMADNPNTPGPDPMCADRNAMEWVDAWLNKKEPPKNKVGFMYMLAGGTDASNTDPYAQKPEPNNNWVETGPHVMIVGAKGLLDAYPRSPKPDTSVPYVMWPDTAYEHLMIPVR